MRASKRTGKQLLPEMTMSAQIQRQRSPVYVGEAARRVVFLRRQAERMLAEFESRHLEVVLIPAPEKKHSLHCIRAVQESNADWYRKFCDAYQRRRQRRSFKSDTVINRQDTERGLRELMKGRCVSIYAKRLADFIDREQKRTITRF